MSGNVFEFDPLATLLADVAEEIKEAGVELFGLFKIDQMPRFGKFQTDSQGNPFGQLLTVLRVDQGVAITGNHQGRLEKFADP